MSYSIFISYRREDSQAAVSSLYKNLLDRFGKNAVFADTASIESGEAWSERIGKTLEEAKLILVVIGDNWLCAEKDDPAQFRICSKEDWVRKEIEAAMALNKIIVPIFLDDIKRPSNPDLPESIINLWNIQARKIKLQAGDDGSLESLLEFLDKKLKSLESPDNLKENLENVLVDKYEIIKSLGDGNRAKVYQGRDKGLDRYVAIKAIINPVFNDEFIETLKTATKINDCVTNSISILGAYVTKDPMHVIMPYLQGGSLRRTINENEGEPLPYDYVKEVLLKIGNALVKIHQKEIYHFNVKPSNIILNNNEPYLNPLTRVQKIVKGAVIKKLSDTSAFSDAAVYKEELCYLPPEKFDNIPGNDPLPKGSEKIDQYMLGLVGYELLTGSIPDTVSDIADLRENGISAFKPLGSVAEIRKDCPHKFSRIIHKMTDYDPGNRYDSLEDALNAIEEVSFDHFEIAKDSYARCISGGDSGNSFFKTFYHELTRISPEAAVKFKGKGIGETETNRQYGILREAIFILLMFGENKLGENEPNILSRIAEMHNKNHYNISPESYKSFVSALTATICGSAPDIPEPFDPQCKISVNEKNLIKIAWQKALKPGIDYMIMRYPG